MYGKLKSSWNYSQWHNFERSFLKKKGQLFEELKLGKQIHTQGAWCPHKAKISSQDRGTAIVIIIKNFGVFDILSALSHPVLQNQAAPPELCIEKPKIKINSHCTT
jgi:hypothetical protein